MSRLPWADTVEKKFSHINLGVVLRIWFRMCGCWCRVAGVSGDWLAKKNSALAGGVFAMARANRRDVLILSLHKSGTARAVRCRKRASFPHPSRSAKPQATSCRPFRALFVFGHRPWARAPWLHHAAPFGAEPTAIAHNGGQTGAIHLSFPS